jgi:hypothetical protein
MTKAKSTSKLTPAMAAMLTSLSKGKPYDAHLRGMAARGGADMTLHALSRRKFAEFDHGWMITSEGRDALKEYIEGL